MTDGIWVSCNDVGTTAPTSDFEAPTSMMKGLEESVFENGKGDLELEHICHQAITGTPLGLKIDHKA